jgi:PKHD-type hydroxylase|tara:strand:+ start:4519 stop:5118 length:600 start_codon:yes stop_codon:yes gene_type:complete
MNIAYTYPIIENDPQNYYYFEDGFSKEELKKIEKGVARLPLNTATTVGGLNIDTRTSRVKWVPQENNWAWLYEKLADYALQANDSLWNFNLHTLPEQIQYTEYLGSKNGKYEWHQDIGPGMLSWRKVSITVQLSEPDEYEGGDLQVFQGGEYKEQNFINAPRKAGCVFIFPSYMLHRVTPVTKGIRKSFVLWSGGGHYK